MLFRSCDFSFAPQSTTSAVDCAGASLHRNSFHAFEDANYLRALHGFGESLRDGAVDGVIEHHADMRAIDFAVLSRIVFHATAPVGDAVLARVDGELRDTATARRIHIAYESAGAVAGAAGCVQIAADKRALREFEFVPYADDGGMGFHQ